MNREIPLYTLEGVKDAKVTTHYFNTEDGLGLSMLRLTGGSGDRAILTQPTRFIVSGLC